MRVSVLTVSHNTKELTALLLWSVRRVLVTTADVDVLVIDNASTDGSHDLTGCSMIRNDDNVGHGSAINQGLEALGARDQRPHRVWILDSDCVIARPDALDAALAVGADAAIVGESQWDRWHGVERFELCSLLIDPALVPVPGVSFAADGDPAFPVLEASREAGHVLAPFPFTADGYVIHRGRSTLAVVRDAGDTANPLHEWAVDHHEPHWGGIEGAAARHAELVARFRSE